jgi:broad specificity phosphatase PhoE
MAKLIALLGRHGEIEANNRPEYRGFCNEALDEQGIKDAQQRALKLSRYGIKRIISSPLLRARQTAEIDGKALGLPYEQEGALLPFNCGFFTGLDKEVTADAYKLFMQNPDVKIPNGESVNDIHKRIGEYFGPALKDAAELTLYEAHSSTGVCLKNLLAGELKLFPGVDEVVEPGGVVGIFDDGKDGYVLEVVEEP